MSSSPTRVSSYAIVAVPLTTTRDFRRLQMIAFYLPFHKGPQDLIGPLGLHFKGNCHTIELRPWCG
jgi:hypothetical protein